MSIIKFFRNNGNNNKNALTRSPGRRDALPSIWTGGPGRP